VKQVLLPRLEARFTRILSKFKINLNMGFPPTGTREEDCQRWWRDYIIEGLQSTFDWDYSEIKLMVSKASGSVMPSEKELNSLLEACDAIEKVVASIPVEVLSIKPKSPLKEAKVASAVPRWVKMWRTLNRALVDAPLKRGIPITDNTPTRS
jgi:hypothetical protein